MSMFDKHRGVGVPKGNEVLFDVETALLLIDECLRHGTQILGMDFYFLRDGEIVEMPCPADYSTLSGPGAAERSAQAAKDLLLNRLPIGTVLISFVLDELE